MTIAQLSDFDRLPTGHRRSRPHPARATPDQLAREVELASASSIVKALLQASDSILLVLNAQRQIVASSKSASAIVADVIGRRPGEAFACVNAQGPLGCGTAPGCETCGALGAILASRRSGRPTEAECLLRSVAGDGLSFEFNVRAAPVEIGGVEFTVFALRDISGEKRRHALEQIFFHDVLNTVCGLRGWSERLLAADADHRRAAERIDVLTRRIEREIRDHRDLVLAENGTLTVASGRVRGAALQRELEILFASHPDAKDRRLEISVEPPELELWTDPSLLLRVLVNMVRNAFEATAPGGAVRMCAARDGGRVRFSVHNGGEIPLDVQCRIFQRSFSTKGASGRGLGTYSMKLLGERYLGGAVSFESTLSGGTTFTIALPAGRAIAAA
jgi:signal transduction histidine kinase